MGHAAYVDSGQRLPKRKAGVTHVGKNAERYPLRRLDVLRRHPVRPRHVDRGQSESATLLNRRERPGGHGSLGGVRHRTQPPASEEDRDRTGSLHRCLPPPHEALR